MVNDQKPGFYQNNKQQKEPIPKRTFVHSKLFHRYNSENAFVLMEKITCNQTLLIQTLEEAATDPSLYYYED